MDGARFHPPRLLVEIEDAAGREDEFRPAPVEAQASPPGEAAGVADARYVIHPLDEIPRFVAGHHDVFAAEQRHVFGMQDRPHQASLRTRRVADADAVEVAPDIDLRAGGEAETHVAALDRQLAGPVDDLRLAGQVAQGFVELGIGERAQTRQVGVVRPSGEKDRQVRRMHELRQGHRGERNAGDVDRGGASRGQARIADLAVAQGQRERRGEPLVQGRGRAHRNDAAVCNARRRSRPMRSR